MVAGPIGELATPSCFGQFRRDCRRRCAGIDRELKRAAAVGMDIDQNEGLGRTGQTHRDFGHRRGLAEPLDSSWILQANLAFAIIERDPEMLEEIVAEVAVDLRADRLANVAEIDQSHIDIVQFRRPTAANSPSPARQKLRPRHFGPPLTRRS